MMNVLYLLNFAGKAGTERYVETLVRHLGGTKINPFFAYNVDGLLVERLTALGVPTRQVPMESRFDKTAARTLAALCQEWHIDLIHCHYLREHYIALLAKKYNPNIRVVYTNHFVIANNLITRLSNRRMDKKQDEMIAVCNKGRQQLVKNGWSGDRIQVVFNGVDLADWQGGDSTLRQEFGISSDRVVMLCASRFAEDKGHAYLVNALKVLTTQTDTPFTLVLAGDGPLLDTVKEQVKSLGLAGHVVFTGFRTDMKNLYGGSDIYINASQHEALSFLIIEAMAAGLPVIVTDMGGNRDIVPPDATWGQLVRYNDPQAMATAMKTVVEDAALRQAQSQAARQIVDERFNIHTLAETTYQVYEKAVKR